MAPRTPLLRPDSYFAERVPNGVRGLVVAGVATLGGLGLVAALGAVLAAKIDGTVTVDNPNRPPETFCDGGSSFGNTGGFNCSAPPEVERNVDTLLSAAVGELYAPLLVGVPLLMVVVAALLHAGTAAAGGEGGFGGTFSVTAWGFIPPLVTAALAVGAFWFLLDPVTVSGNTAPDTLRRSVLDDVRRVGTVALGLNLVGTAWSVAVCTFGLERARSVSRAAAATLGVVVFGGLYLVSLA